MLTPDIESKIRSVIERFDASFYFYDLDQLQSHLASMADQLDPDLKLWYACKANPMSAVLKIMRNMHFGIDVASSGELHQVLNTGIKGSNIIATGPGKSKDYLRHLLENKVQTIIIESINQLKWLDEVCQEKSSTQEVLLRVQLDWDEGKSVLGGDEITPFGISPEDWSQVDFKTFKQIIFKGVHVFQWGNILDIKRLEIIWRKTIQEVQNFTQKNNLPLEILDLGGGLGVPYTEKETAVDFQKVHQLLKDLKSQFKLQRIWMELGRYSVAQAGLYITKIVDMKPVRGKQLLVTSGGINHCARVALTKQSFPATLLGAKSGEAMSEFQVHGPLCTALDKLGTFMLPKRTQIGDWLIFSQAGAYGFTESMPYFLCHELPGEVISYKNDLMIPRPPKTSYDWMI